MALDQRSQLLNAMAKAGIPYTKSCATCSIAALAEHIRGSASRMLSQSTNFSVFRSPHSERRRKALVHAERLALRFL